MGLTVPARVLVRAVAASYGQCLRTDAKAEPDVERARHQHGEYVALLRRLGVDVAFVDAADDLPDACFIEDTAVVVGRHSLLTRPGAPSRRAEITAVSPHLEAHGPLHRMVEPGTLDGGDVLRVGHTFFIGLSARTNADGARALAGVAREEAKDAVVVPVRGGLHLKSACTLVDLGTLVYAREVFEDDELAPFRRRGLTCIAAEEPAGANVLAIGDDVLVSAEATGTARLLERRGHRVHRVALDEIHKGDGALTCLSLRLPGPGGTCT